MRGGHLGGCDHANWRMEVAPSSQLLPQSHICGRLLLAAGECQVGTKVKLFVVLVMYIYSIIFFFSRFNAARGQSDLALDTLQRIADENKSPMLLGRLIVDDDHLNNFYERGRFTDLLSAELRRTTLYLWFIWASCR